MTQLVGRDCVACNKRIISALDAEFCESCGNPVHRQCRENYQASGDKTRCQRCGGSPEAAPRGKSESAAIYPEYWLYGLVTVIVLAVAVFALWPPGGSSGTSDKPDQEEKSQEDTAAKGNPVVEIETNFGAIRAELFADKAPETVENFVDLVEQEFYDGIIFHRVIPGFMIQTGDPLGRGTGGRTDKGLPPKQLMDEFHPDLRHDKPGVLSMANSGPNTGDTQFFITTVATPHLDDKHAIFGQVIEGMDVVRKIESLPTDAGDRPREEAKMLRVRMVEPAK